MIFKTRTEGSMVTDARRIRMAGDAGNGANIPVYSTLIFDAELVAVRQAM